MNALTFAIVLLIPTVLGLLIAFVSHRLSLSRLQLSLNEERLALEVEKERNAEKTRQINTLESKLNKIESSYQALQRACEDAKIKNAALQTQLEQERRSLNEKMAWLEQAKKNMSDSFENLANKIMEKKNQVFVSQNQSSLDNILGPLREQLKQFRKMVETTYDKETKDRMSLYHEIKNLKSLNQQMSQDAINLTNALKGDNKRLGQWGEVILEKILEDSGLEKGREYSSQANYRDKEGRLYRPDVIIHLPDNRDIVIDSKISLNAYTRYHVAEQEEEKQQALHDHLQAIRRHITDLKKRPYSQLLGLNSLDMVFMFVGVESALILALEKDPHLFQQAFEDGIVLISPSTLMMNLQIIYNLWRYEHQNQNAKEIANRAADMYDKLVGFVAALNEIGERLDQARQAYDTARGRLSTGKGNLISKAEALRKLGLKTNKKLPDELQDTAEDLPEIASPSPDHR